MEKQINQKAITLFHAGVMSAWAVEADMEWKGWIWVTSWSRIDHEGVITPTHLELDILECKVRWALGSITMNKASGDDGIPVVFHRVEKESDTTERLNWTEQKWICITKKSISHENF